MWPSSRNVSDGFDDGWGAYVWPEDELRWRCVVITRLPKDVDCEDMITAAIGGTPENVLVQVAYFDAKWSIRLGLDTDPDEGSILVKTGDGPPARHRSFLRKVISITGGTAIL